jgi:23S rRNA pseudouridine1911/1915/1917 synthase
VYNHGQRLLYAGCVSKGDRTWTVGADEAGQRLDKYLAAPDRAGSRRRASDALARGRVFVNREEADPTTGSRLVGEGDVVRLWIDRPGSASRKPRPATRDGLDIVHEDEDLVVVNKPAGLLTVPLDGDSSAPSVLALLWDRFRSHGTRAPLVVHRIDKDTSGLVLFALHERAQKTLVAQFARRTPDRVYLALVIGHPSPTAGTWHDRLAWDADAFVQRPAREGDPEARDAAADYRVVSSFAESSLLEVRLHTGRQGQIRAQAQLRGHALVGDRRYRPREGAPGHGIAFPRQALHAQRLAFDHPADGRRVEVTAPMPEDLRALVDRLRRQARQQR